MFQFVTELLGRLRLGGYAPEYVRSILDDPSAPIKGVTAKLHFTFGTADEGYCATYTFKEANK